MNHITLAIVAMLAAITASALTATIAISIIQNAAAQTTTDLENSGTNSKFKQKEKNNCSGFTGCDNVGTETLVPPSPPPCVGTEGLVPPA
jgi:hypothetical protein